MSTYCRKGPTNKPLDTLPGRRKAGGGGKVWRGKTNFTGMYTCGSVYNCTGMRFRGLQRKRGPGTRDVLPENSLFIATGRGPLT